MIDSFFTNINLPNTTKPTLLDSLLQEFTAGEIQTATCPIQLSLYFLIQLSKRLFCGSWDFLKLQVPDTYFAQQTACYTLVYCWQLKYLLTYFRSTHIDKQVGTELSQAQLELGTKPYLSGTHFAQDLTLVKKVEPTTLAY